MALISEERLGMGRHLYTYLHTKIKQNEHELCNHVKGMNAKRRRAVVTNKNLYLTKYNSLVSFMILAAAIRVLIEQNMMKNSSKK